MQRDRYLVAAGVGDGVVFVRRDHAAGAAGTGIHAAGGAEAETPAVTFEQLVPGDLQFPVPDALNAPHAPVLLDRHARSRRPGYRHPAATTLGAAVKTPPRPVSAQGD